MSQKTEAGGRWGRTPFRPDDLREQYGTTDSGRLDVTCPGCGRDFYPVANCCIKGGSRTADPFCPDCGTDFRASEENIETHQLVQARAGTEEAVKKLRAVIEETPGIRMVGETTVVGEVTEKERESDT